MKKLSALFFLLLYSFSSFACTTFLLSKDGKHLFGRNYDWITGSGMLMINARGLVKTSFSSENKSFNWVSSYGSVSFNQYGKEFPTGGMNEKGLVVELMWLDETSYPTKDNRNELGVLQWIQYQLDCSKTVEEVIASDKLIRINDDVPLHYLVSDANGNAATIEFLNGKMVVHQKQDLVFPVLTNSTYQESLEKTGGRIQTKNSPSFQNNSLQRFATACQMVQRVKTMEGVPTVDHAFSILNEVSQGDFTVWNIVYDISNKAVHFKTSDNQQTRSLDMSGLDFSCKQMPAYFPLNNKTKGNITALLLPFTSKENRVLLEKSAEESKSRVPISKAYIDKAITLAASSACQ